MPKFTYSASKGIEQSSGSGFVINDVAITSTANTVAAAGTCNAYGVNVLEGVATLPDPSDATAIGTQVIVTFAGADLLTITSGTNKTGAGAGDVGVFIWNGSAWIEVSS